MNLPSEGALKANKAHMIKLEARSIEREDLLGKVEADRDQKSKELGEKDTELSESAAKLAQALEENEKIKKENRRTRPQRCKRSDFRVWRGLGVVWLRLPRLGPLSVLDLPRSGRWQDCNFRLTFPFATLF